ncbi:28S ribosomal protein S10, mitochondrial [Anthonomus grandis grandis]|uniref:28S ribosomal protein S10, mitochondrial n=1 Tax=Anthonomus grandis grandis TaxID=2921223 RepID=UPI0021650892|nr:28S ribosomal protein S10, mitochondrial [Anthonomus grandis grandis]
MNIIRQTVLKRSHRGLSTLPSATTVAPIEPIEEPDRLIRTLELECKSNEPAVLRSFCKFALSVGNNFGIECKSWTPKKPIHERYTVLKVVHIFKKHRVQYETRTYFSFVQYQKMTGSTADTLLEYVQRNLPEGVALKATKVEVQEIPEHLRENERQDS